MAMTRDGHLRARLSAGGRDHPFMEVEVEPNGEDFMVAVYIVWRRILRPCVSRRKVLGAASTG